MRSRKSSVRVTLVLIGTAAVAGCDDGPRFHNRDYYATQGECRADWNRRPEDCQQTTRPGSSSRVWMGPGYDSTTDRPRSSRAIGTSSTTVSRGGFGSSSGFHSSGG